MATGEAAPTAVFFQVLKFVGQRIFTLDKTRAVSVFNSVKNDRYWLFLLSHSIAN